jgi:hypothetical protein
MSILELDAVPHNCIPYVYMGFRIKIYRTIIFPVVLYGCETWSLTLREERRLRVFENRVLKRIFGPRRNEVTGEWRRSVLLTQYCAGDKIEKNEVDGACSAYGERRGVYRVLVGKPGGRRPLERPRRRWEDNINTGLREVGCGCVDWIGLAQDRDRWRALVSAVMNLWVP